MCHLVKIVFYRLQETANDVRGTCIPNDSRHTVLHLPLKYRHICHWRLRLGSGTRLAVIK